MNMIFKYMGFVIPLKLKLYYYEKDIYNIIAICSLGL